jgi:hypothetical protein
MCAAYFWMCLGRIFKWMADYQERCSVDFYQLCAECFERSHRAMDRVEEKLDRQ